MPSPYRAKADGDKILRLLSSTVSSLNFDLVLMHGTCLGFVRNHDFIDYDNDIDVGILSNFKECTDEEKRRLSEKLLQKGFKHPRSGMLSGAEHWWMHDILVCIQWKFNWLEQVYLKSFDKVAFNGQIYNVPHPVAEYLAKQYPPQRYGGKDWRTPHLRPPPKS